MDQFGLTRVGSQQPEDNGRPNMSMAEAWTQGYPGPPNRDRAEEGSLLECWQILRQRAFKLVLCGIVGFGLGLLFARAQAPVYRALATLELEDSNSSLPSIGRNLQGAQPNMVLSDLQTQIELLQSETLTMKTMDKLKEAALLSGRPIQLRQSPLMQFFHAPLPNPTIGTRAQLLLVADSLNVRSAGVSRVLEIRTESTDPKLAADFANTLVDEYIEENVDERLKLNERNNDWLAQQLDEMRQKLAGSESAMQAYARANGLLFTGTANDQSKTNVSEEKLRELQQSLSTATADRATKEATYRIAAASLPDALPDVLNDSGLRELKSKITDLKRQLADLSTEYTGDFAKVKRLKEQLQTLDSAFAAQTKEVLDKIGNTYNEAKLRENLLLSDYQSQARVVTRDSEKSIQYQLLSHEVDSNRQLYDSMLQRVKETRIDNALRASNVRKVDSARIPILPIRPRTKVDAAVGMLLGFFFGAAAFIILDRADRSIRTPGEMLAALPVPELGVIPRGAGRKSLMGRVGLGFNGDSPLIAESFRVVMTSMLISSEKGPGWRTLVCTSSNAAEGKTTVVANLAVALSKIGKNVLLIDADLSQPSIHHVFALPNTRGLTTLLQGESMSPGEIQASVQRAPQGISVLTAGPKVPNAANLLFAGRVPELLTTLKQDFDLILIDTPPTPQMPHARLLGKMTDGVILVVRARRTTKETLQAAVQRLAVDRIPVLGTILNDWDPRRSSSDYYGSKTRRNSRGAPHTFADAMDVPNSSPWDRDRG
jgi:polysaccharide biosynthesis transport protein